MTKQRNTTTRADFLRVFKFITGNEIDTSLYRSEDLCNFIFQNTGIRYSPVQLKKVFVDAELEWNVIGARVTDGTNKRRTVKIRIDELEPKVLNLEERVAALEKAEEARLQGKIGPFLRPLSNEG
jgi:ABC-type iron transport system FetAB ATPase subunit